MLATKVGRETLYDLDGGSIASLGQIVYRQNATQA
jgi:hypothetical protein